LAIVVAFIAGGVMFGGRGGPFSAAVEEMAEEMYPRKSGSSELELWDQADDEEW
jgi:hypothetical protein